MFSRDIVVRNVGIILENTRGVLLTKATVTHRESSSDEAKPNDASTLRTLTTQVCSVASLRRKLQERLRRYAKIHQASA